MNTQSPDKRNRQLWHRYRDNLPRHLLSLSHYLQSQAMHQLIEQRGHSDLKISFEPYISLLGNHGRRPTELADILGISKQACNQTANLIEAAGYIERKADPLDGRAKRLLLTKRGRQLMRDGAAIAYDNEAIFRQLAGKKPIDELTLILAELHRGLSLPSLKTQDIDSPAYLSKLLPRLGSYVMHRLMQMTISKGHPGLKMCSGQVLTLIGLSGGSIQQMARIQQVSKQAISAIVNELEQLGYLYRETNPTDARQQLILFTTAGLDLLADSVSSVDELDNEFSAVIGDRALQRLKSTTSELYRGLQLEENVFGSQPNLQTLVQELKQQLGQRDLKKLTRLLQTEVLA